MNSILEMGAIPESLIPYLGPPDKRVKDWLLLNNPLYVAVILIMYFSFIVIGNKIMKKREPMDLRAILVFYNIGQVTYSAYMLKEVTITTILSKYSWVCQQQITETNELTIRMARVFWLFYISKIIDLCDTAFIVLRKKTSQITYLNMYHHSTMVFNWYIGTLYMPGGQGFFTVLLNTFVHTVMYTYYLLASMGPRMRKYLWWKKYLTQIQIVQFISALTHLYIGYKNGCRNPPWIMAMSSSYMLSLLVLFLHYYIRAYLSSPATKKIILSHLAAPCYNQQILTAKFDRGDGEIKQE